MAGLLAILCFMTLVSAGYALAGWVQQRLAERREVVNRLRSLAGTQGEGHARSLLKDQRLSGIPMVDAILAGMPFLGPIVRMIRQSGIRRRVGEVLLYIPLVGMIGYLVLVLLKAPQFIAVIAGLVCACVPLVVVARMRRKRAVLFAEQLPEALDLVRSALQAGHGLIAAFQVVTETFPDPISQEFRYLVDEVRLGLPFRDALYNLASRVDDVNIPILVVGVLTAQEVGGNMAEVIENITYTIREREKLHREVRVLTAQGRLSGLVLTVLPFAVGLFFFLWNDKYFHPMTTTRGGQLMLAYAFVSLVLGHFMIRRIVHIKV